MTPLSSQGPILLPERLYTPSPSKTRSPVTIRHVSSSPILHTFIDKAVKKNSTWNDMPKRKDQCLCSPGTNPKAFKCSMHRNSNSNVKSGDDGYNKTVSLYHRLYVRRKALVNSFNKLGTKTSVESGLMKRGLASLVKPSARQLRRRDNEFRPRPSRLSVMSKD